VSLGRLACALIAVLASLPAAAQARPGFLAGAAKLDTTPPAAASAAGATADARYAPEIERLCPAAVFGTAPTFALQEPSPCDANVNGRIDGIYADDGRGLMSGVHDPIDVRTFAVGDGVHRPVVLASVDLIGIFDWYTDQARSLLARRYGIRADLVVTATHNESSPDSIGLYGPFQTPAGVGLRSGIDEYYMRLVDDRIAAAAARAVRSMRPARLYANQVSGPLPDGASGNRYPLLTGLSQRISDQFPTAVALPRDDRIAAIDPKLGVLQARDRAGRPIFTLISVAAHNQEMGNAGPGVSADWPGALEHAFDAATAGVAVFVPGDNGSEEDPQTDPPVIPDGSENHTNQATQYVQAQATGRRFAAIAAAAVRSATRVSYGAVRLFRQAICVPLENNGFLALAAIGEFGRRQGWICDRSGHPIAPIPNGSGMPTASSAFRTFVSYADIGPDLQLIDNPGEAFPALMLGSPFGVEDESCARPNPAVPTWHARGLYRFQVGLADDLIGYLIPAWAFASGTPGLFNTDACYQDMHGHGHKLESESVGPTGSNNVANALAALLDREPDPSAHVVQGRFVRADGSLSRWPTGAVGVVIAPAGAGSLSAPGGTLIADPAVRSFGTRAVDASGLFMDYDGQPQAAADVKTRGMMVLDAHGCVTARFYLNVFPALGGPSRIGAAVSRHPLSAPSPCRSLVRRGVPELQPGAARAAGLRRRSR
jgi:hypothetical protein